MSTSGSRALLRTSGRCRAVVLAVVISVATTLAACGSEPDGGGSDPGFGTVSMHYSWIKDEDYAGQFYAEDKGYYEEADFDAVNGISGPGEGVAQLLSGKVQVAISDAAAVGSVIAEQDAKLKIIGATLQKNPLTIVSLEGAGIATPADLVGKRIGVRDADIDILRALLAANGLEEQKNDITIVPAEFDARPLVDGGLDGFVAELTDESIIFELAGHEVKDLPFADNGLPYVAQTYTVTDQYLAENRDLLEALLIAEIKGWTETFRNPGDEVVEVVTTHFEEAAGDSDGLEASFGELDPAKVERGLEVSQQLISTPETEKNGLLTISAERQQQTIDSLAAAGWEVSAEDLFDTSILDEIYAEHPELKAYRK
ncbi:ABC transporter substrate-binding protein [Nocardioides sp. CCNWLW239]|uniref:ABC transporter substrate-binding protein n=1 Tax=Nocardioides sp. CCNWLW239 TaxID=3128902 RepID=UPI003019AEF6